MRLLFLAAGALALWGCVSPSADANAASHDELAFISAEAVDSSVPDNGSERNDSNASAALLFTGTYSNFHALTEAVISTEEVELERFQLGWEPVPDVAVWLGRFHQPSSYWNTEFHHGQFLQTSITRPAIESWEDFDGPLPQHFAGMLVELSHSLRRGAAIRAAVGAGAAAVLELDALRPSNLDDAFEEHKFGLSARIDWLPDALGETSVGLVAGHSEIALDIDAGAPELPLGSDHFDLTTIGGYFDIHHRGTRYLGALYRIASALDINDTPSTDHVWSYYAQLAHSVAERWQLYARYERTPDARQSAYFSRFPALIERRALAGVRWDLYSKNALTVEYGRVGMLGAAGANEIRVQWSAVLP